MNEKQLDRILSKAESIVSKIEDIFNHPILWTFNHAFWTMSLVMVYSLLMVRGTDLFEKEFPDTATFCAGVCIVLVGYFGLFVRRYVKVDRLYNKLPKDLKKQADDYVLELARVANGRAFVGAINDQFEALEVKEKGGAK
jgi:hypothetical protein